MLPVQVWMGVPVESVPVGVHMDLASTPEFSQRTRAKDDEHDGDHQFQDLRGPLTNLNMQQDDSEAGSDEGKCVPDPPQPSDQGCAQDALTLADNSRDRRQMIGFHCVLQSETKAEGQD